MCSTSRRLFHPTLLLALAAGALAAPAAAQERASDLPPGVQDLPIGFSPEELALVRMSGSLGLGRGGTAPPQGPVRAAAEWDESIGVFCLWPNAELFDELQQENDVYIITTNQSWWVSWLASNGIPSTNIHYLNAPTNTWWVRDYGPWFMWDGNGEFGLVDNVYNRPRPLDDVIPFEISQAYGVPYYGMDLVHTGGNYYADGYGSAWSSRLQYSENPGLSEGEVNQFMLDFLGIARYVARDLDYDIEHIDTFGKILAPDTILWGDFPENTTPWIYCEAALKHYRTLQSAYGWPYKIHRMPLWNQSSSWTAYINSLQTMKKIVVARHGNSHDAEARAIYEQAAPGYEVAQVASLGTNWGDSVHCRARNFMRGDALRIYPRPHWEAVDDAPGSYEVRAEVIPERSATLAGAPQILWSTTGGPPFTTELMTPGAGPDEYVGWIPAQPPGSTISYYLHAQDTAGRTKDSPLVAPDGTFTIRVADDRVAPELEHDALHALTPAAWPPTLTCTAIDDTGIPTVVLEYSLNGAPQPPLAMLKEEGTFVFSGTPAGSVQLGDLVAYRIVATDGATPANAASAPNVGWNTFTIENVQPVLVIELDESPDSGALLVDVCDDLGLSVESTDAWPTSLSGYGTVMVCLGMNPTNTALDSSQANALVSFLNAGGTAYVEGGNCWAQDSSSSIYRSWFGLASASSGSDLSANVIGVAGEFSEGMSFGYYGERKSSDHLTPAASARAVLTSSAQVKALTYSTGTYSTVAASFQVGDLVDGNPPSRAKHLVGRTLDHLGLEVSLIVHCDPHDPRVFTVELRDAPNAPYALLYALGPGYRPKGSAGVLRIDPDTARVFASGLLPGDGELSAQYSIALLPAMAGAEVYFQAIVQEGAPGRVHLSNRDRVTFELD